MIFPKVVLEFVTLVSVANVEAETGADAISIAASNIDIKSLLERHPRPYSPDLRSTSLLSIEAALNPTAAAIYSPYEDGYVASTYEIDQEGVIKPADVLPKAVISQLARDSAAILVAALSKKDDQQLLEAAKMVAKSLYVAGLLNLPATPEEISSGTNPPDANVDYFENFSAPLTSETEPSFHSVITDYIASDKVSKTESSPSAYKMVSSFFVVPASQENIDKGFAFQIEFGEIDVEYDGVKIASIGTWREFASQNILYIDDQKSVDDARETILSINGLSAAFVEKPSLSGKIDALIDI